MLVPVLGDHYGRVLEAKELLLDRRGGRFVVRYVDHELPISPRSVDGLLAAAARRAASGDLAELAEEFGSLPLAGLTDRTAVRERHECEGALARSLERGCVVDRSVVAAVDDEVTAWNADPDRLDGLLRRRNSRLAYWRNASNELDYRRFFNIESLVGVRVEEAWVFDQTHDLSWSSCGMEGDHRPNTPGSPPTSLREISR